MHDSSDMDLVRDYVRLNSEAAFAELVQRHITLVYSVALRHVGISAQAEEITQAVFVILARKATRLRVETILEGWLYETTRLTALSFLRSERRRQIREQEAYMQFTIQESNNDPTWNQLAPMLDEAMGRLGKKDRDAVVLRFFKGKRVGEVAAALETSEAATQRRLLRALEKLRKFFMKRGVNSTTAVIAETISSNSVQTAPALLAKTATAVALAKGAAASASTLTLINGALKLMAWTKAKMAIAAGAAAILAAGTMTIAITTMMHPKNDPASNPLLTNVLNILADVQRGSAGQTVTAIVEIKKMSPPPRIRGPVVEMPATNSYQTRQSHLTLSYFPWGYAAEQQTINDTSTPAMGVILDNWCIRSNNFSEDEDTYANPTSRGLYLTGRNMEVLVHSGFRPSFASLGVNVCDLYGVITNFHNVNIIGTADSDSNHLFVIEGLWDIPDGSATERFQIAFDPAHKMFPIKGTIYLDGKLLTQWQGIFSGSNDGGYFPQAFWLKVFRNKTLVFSENYTDIKVENSGEEADDLLRDGNVPRGANVSDYRFSRPFAYVEGPQSPTPEMLSVMATNTAATREYQMSAFTGKPFVKTPQTHGRWLVIAALGLFVILSCFAFLRAKLSTRTKFKA